MTGSEHGFTRGRKVGIRIAAGLGLILFTFFFSVVAAEAMDIIQAGAEGSPADPLRRPLPGSGQPTRVKRFTSRALSPFSRSGGRGWSR